MNRTMKNKLKKLYKKIEAREKEIAIQTNGKTPKEQHEIEDVLVADMFYYWDKIDIILSAEELEVLNNLSIKNADSYLKFRYPDKDERITF